MFVSLIIDALQLCQFVAVVRVLASLLRLYVHNVCMQSRTRMYLKYNSFGCNNAANGNSQFVNRIHINTSAIETLYSPYSNDLEYHLTRITSLVSSVMRYIVGLKTVRFTLTSRLSGIAVSPAYNERHVILYNTNCRCRNYRVDCRLANFINIDHIKQRVESTLSSHSRRLINRRTF